MFYCVRFAQCTIFFKSNICTIIKCRHILSLRIICRMYVCMKLCTRKNTMPHIPTVMCIERDNSFLISKFSSNRSKDGKNVTLETSHIILYSLTYNRVWSLQCAMYLVGNCINLSARCDREDERRRVSGVALRKRAGL